MFKINIFFYTLAHLCVDMVCMWVMAYIFLQNPQEGLKFVLIYNFFAFGFQPIAGIILDKIKKPSYMSAVSFLIMSAGIFISLKNNTFGAVIIGIANSVFHISGGMVVYGLKPDAPKWQGVFISSGGIGLALGTIAAKSSFPFQYSVLIMIFLFFAVLLIKPPEIRYKTSAPKLEKNIFVLLLILIVAAITMRSVLGLEFSSVITSGSEKWFLILAVAFGKCAGGFLTEKFGALNSIIIPLLITLPFLFFGMNIFIFAVIAAGIAQLSTALTLDMLFASMPGRPGLAFGINCLAVFLGLLIILFISVHFPKMVVIYAAVLICAVSIFIVLKRFYADRDIHYDPSINDNN